MLLKCWRYSRKKAIILLYLKNHQVLHWVSLNRWANYHCIDFTVCFLIWFKVVYSWSSNLLKCISCLSGCLSIGILSKLGISSHFFLTKARTEISMSLCIILRNLCTLASTIKLWLNQMCWRSKEDNPWFLISEPSLISSSRERKLQQRRVNNNMLLK